MTPLPDDFDPEMPRLEEIAPGFRVVASTQAIVVEEDGGGRWVALILRLQEGYGATPIVLALDKLEASRTIRDVAVCLERIFETELEEDPEHG